MLPLVVQRKALLLLLLFPEGNSKKLLPGTNGVVLKLLFSYKIQVEINPPPNSKQIDYFC